MNISSWFIEINRTVAAEDDASVKPQMMDHKILIPFTNLRKVLLSVSYDTHLMFSFVNIFHFSGAVEASVDTDVVYSLDLFSSQFVTVSTFTCTVKLSYGHSSIRSFNWTTVLVPVYKHRGRINLLSNSAMVGGDVSHSAGCYWIFFRLAQQATNKLASG